MADFAAQFIDVVEGLDCARHPGNSCGLSGSLALVTPDGVTTVDNCWTGCGRLMNEAT